MICIQKNCTDFIPNVNPVTKDRPCGHSFSLLSDVVDSEPPDMNLDETMHSGADVDAFTAALNRDIEGNKSASQPSNLDNAHLSKEYRVDHSVSHWHNSSQDENTNRQIQYDMNGCQRQEPHISSTMGSNNLQNPPIQAQRVQTQQTMPPQNPANLERTNDQHTMPPQLPVSLQRESKQQTVPPQHPANLQRINNQQTVPPQLSAGLHRTSSQQTISPQHPANFHGVNNQQTTPTQNPATAAKNQERVMSLEQLIAVIVPHVDKDKSQQLHTLYIKLRKNEVRKEECIRLMKNIVGEQMIKLAAYKLQNQGQIQQAGGSNQPPHSSLQPHQKGILPPAELARQHQLSAPQAEVVSSNTMAGSNGKDRDSQMNIPPIHSLNKQQQQNFQISQEGVFPIYGNNNGPLSGSNINTSAATSARMRQGHGHQVIGGSSVGTYNQSTNAPMGAKRNNLNSSSVRNADNEARVSGVVKDKASSMGFSSSMGTIPSNPVPRSITAQLNMQTHGIPSAALGNDAKTPPKTPLVGQKKPLESVVSSTPQPSKKQKVSGGLADQSIEQLNDVTAVSGVNLREEEEQLFSGSKEDTRVSEASQRVVKEEEERLILEKAPLRTKLAGIMLKCGVENMNGEVERCLSLSMEERMRGLISSLIRLSKQRANIEKSRHRTVVTSDVRKLIMAINQKTREEWDKKQSEAERLQKPDESEGNDGVNGDNKKEDGRGKSLKQIVISKDEDDKMRTNAAARAAVGGDDMFSKWQKMAEQARQKRDGGSDMALDSQQGKENRPSRVSKDNQEAERSASQNAPVITGTRRKSARSQIMPHDRVALSISVNDVIAVLEREPQMSKGELLYRLYEKCSFNVE